MSLLWMVIIFVILEILTRLLWNPNYIGENLYGRFDPSYNYGYDTERPIFYNKDSLLICYPTQYLNIYKQYLNQIKDKNEFRIFTFGGSVSKGTEDGNYSYFLEKILNSNFPFRVFKVFLCEKQARKI